MLFKTVKIKDFTTDELYAREELTSVLVKYEKEISVNFERIKAFVMYLIYLIL